MNFTKSLCPHKFEKSSPSINICKKCSTIQLISIPIIIKKKNNDIFCKPDEYCYNFEINAIELIKNKINDDDKNFKNFKIELEQLNKMQDSGSFNNEIDVEESYELSSSNSEKSNKENNYLYSFKIYYKNRRDIILHIKKLCNKYNTSKNCFYLTMALIEEFFINNDEKHISKYQMDLIINSIFILAYKFFEKDSDYFISYKSFKTYFYKEKKHVKEKNLRIAEVQCLQILEYNLNKFTIFNFLELVLSSGIILEKEVLNFNIISKIYNECFKLLDFCFEENDLMIEYPISQIVFSIVYLVRKQNNLIYNIEKNFKKIYNIELKKYLNCIKYISSIYYKNENFSTNLNNKFIIFEDIKKDIFINDKKIDNDKNNTKNNDFKNVLNPIHNLKENQKMIEMKSYDSKKMDKDIFKNINRNIKQIPFSFSRSESLDLIKINNLKNLLNEKSKDNINKNNSILLESSVNTKIKEIEKYTLKPIKLHYSKNSENLRYKNILYDINTYKHIHNNEIKNKNNRNPSNYNSIEINQNKSKYLNFLKDSSNFNNSLKNNKIVKVKSCENIFKGQIDLSKFNRNSINSFRKSCLYKREINSKFLIDKEPSSKLRMSYNFTKKNNNINEENTNKEENNIIKSIYKINDNVNKNKVKLPIIK